MKMTNKMTVILINTSAKIGLHISTSAKISIAKK